MKLPSENPKSREAVKTLATISEDESPTSPDRGPMVTMATKYTMNKTQANSSINSPKIIPGNLKTNKSSLQSARMSQNQITIL